MIATAVSPIAMPPITRRRVGSPISSCGADPGASRSTANTPAEIMNMPSAQPSIRYSGQWARSESRAAGTPASGVGSLDGSIRSASRLEAGIQRHAAIDEQADSRDVVGIVRGEPHHRAANLLRLTDALVRNQFHQLVVGRR